MENKYLVPLGVLLLSLLSFNSINIEERKSIIGWKQSFLESNFKNVEDIFISIRPVAVEIYPEYSKQYYLVKLGKNKLKSKTINIFGGNERKKFLNIYEIEKISETEIEELVNISIIRRSDIQSEYILLEIESNAFKEDKFNLTLLVNDGVFGKTIFLDPDISACGTLASSGTYYMINNISVTANPCIYINVAANLRGQNYYFIGNNSPNIKTISLGTSANNVNISNVNFLNTSVAIYSATNNPLNLYNMTYSLSNTTSCIGQDCVFLEFNRGVLVDNVNISKSFYVFYSSYTSIGTYFNASNINVNSTNFFLQNRVNNVNLANITINNSNLNLSIGVIYLPLFRSYNLSFSNVTITNSNISNALIYYNGGSYISYMTLINITTKNISANTIFLTSPSDTNKNFNISLSNFSGDINTTIKVNSIGSGFFSVNITDSEFNQKLSSTYLFNSTISNSTIRINNSSSNNLYFNNYVYLYNNTFINSTLNFSSNSIGIVTGNKIISDIWIQNNGQISFNTSVYGNEYILTNGTEAWEIYNLTDINKDTWADGGTNYPFNATTISGRWIGEGADWRPRTYSNFTQLEIKVEVWNGTNWTYFNDTNRIVFRCRINGTYPTLCEPIYQNYKSNISAVRIWNLGYKNSTYQAAKVNYTFSNSSLIISRTNNTADGVIIGTSFTNFSTSNLSSNTSINVFLWINVSSYPFSFHPFDLNFSIGG